MDKNKIMDMVKKIIDNKKLLLLIIGIIVVIVVIICLFVFLTPSSSFDSPKLYESYERLNNKKDKGDKKYPKVELTENNKFQKSNENEILEIFNNKLDGVIYFGYPSCVYCRSAIQVLHDVSMKSDLDTIYHLDVEEEKYGKLLKFFGPDLIEDNKIYAPLVIFVVDGQIVSYNKGTLFSQEDPYTSLDESQINGLGEIYKYGINDVIAGGQ